MAYEDLEQRGLFLPEEQWGEADLHSSVPHVRVGAIFCVGVAACVLMAVGAGNALTWIGAAMFPVFLFLFVVVSNGGVNRQNKAVADMMESGDAGD